MEKEGQGCNQLTLVHLENGLQNCVCVCVPVKILLQLFPKVFLETSGGATANPGKLEMAVCEYSQSTMIIHYYTSQQAHLFTSTCVRPS